MKKLTSIVVLPILIILFSCSALAESNSKIKNEVPDAAIQNLLVGLKSDNYGLRTSAAYILGDIANSKAVFPLMTMLRTAESEDARIVAALSLYKIGNATGIFAVKQAGRFDSSERVRKLCQSFYYDHILKQSNENKTENAIAFLSR